VETDRQLIASREREQALAEVEEYKVSLHYYLIAVYLFLFKLEVIKLKEKHTQELDVLSYQVLTLNGGRHKDMPADDEELVSLQFKLLREAEHKKKLMEKLNKAQDEIKQWKVSFIKTTTLLCCIDLLILARSSNAMS
jgi:hypothetical protein